MPDRMTYREIADDLADRIARRDESLFRREDPNQLPSYRELATEYKVSVSTLQRSLSLLHDRRITYGDAGVGVYVRKST